jgi:pyruvate dehydrogenase E2 component (dihydrolipoamide acetyltransferase)
VPAARSAAPAAIAASAPVAAPADESGAATDARGDDAAFKRAHASPSVRLFARELGVDLAQVKGSGPSNRILRQDVQGFVKHALAAPAPAAARGGGVLDLLPWPQIDFSSSAQPKQSRCRGSRRFPARTSRATG